MRIVAAAVTAGLLLPASALPASAGLFEPTTYRLENGLQIVVIEDHRAPVVTHMVWYRVGSADEPPGETGIAHFLEHLMFKGTDEVAPGEFSKIIARHGGRDNAFTSYDYTGYYQTIAADKLEMVMRMEADRMVDLRLSDEDVATERQVVLEERRSRTDNDPGARLAEIAQATQYLSHPYGSPVIGWFHEIEALNREAALRFYKRFYAPNNAILIVAGDVQPEAVRELAKKHYGPLEPSASLPPRLRPQEPPQIAERRVIYRHDQVTLPSLRRTYLAPTRSAGETEHAVPLRVFSEILGGGSTSRLYRSLVVEQSLASGAGAYYDGTGLDSSTFYAYAAVVPGGDLAALETALDEVIAKVLAEGVSEEELRRAKAGLLAAAVYARDNLSTGPRVFGDALTSGLTVEQVEAWPDQVAAVTAEDVLAAARAVIDRRRSVTGLLLPPEGKGS